MTEKEKTQVQKDIGEGFAFARFLLKHPKELDKIKDGSEIRVLPSTYRNIPHARRSKKKVHFVAAETVFRSL